jgi:hypothetical protein
MNERNEKERPRLDTKQAALRTEMQEDPASSGEAGTDRSCYEAPEIRGWALQWDTTALRKMNMARKMRQLRQSTSDQ